jgi:PPE-repeat protein
MIITLLLKKVPDSIKVSFNFQIALLQFISQELVKQVTYTFFIPVVNPDSTIVAPTTTGLGIIGSGTIGEATGFSGITEMGTQEPVIPVAVVPV